MHIVCTYYQGYYLLVYYMFYLISFNHLCKSVLLCFHAHLFVDALWSPAGKGLTFGLSFVMSSCDVVTFRLVS